jgi:hypothetical protein
LHILTLYSPMRIRKRGERRNCMRTPMLTHTMHIQTSHFLFKASITIPMLISHLAHFSLSLPYFLPSTIFRPPCTHHIFALSYFPSHSPLHKKVW